MKTSLLLALMLTAFSAPAFADYGLVLKPKNFTCTGESQRNGEGILIGIGVDEVAPVSDSGAKVFISYLDRPAYENETVDAKLPMINSEDTLTIQQLGPQFNMVLFGDDISRMAEALQHNQVSDQTYNLNGWLMLKGVKYTLSSCSTNLAR